ncbi:ankyrin repeat domain-containing protein 34B isoform X1 [Salmo salar]|uniref:Ankyrin repeat domain-containing protein 34B isoform X1 n=2 Tax=Salmo salar TaxID=8030 RepID=A0A1S3PRS6_SALSA|nr:ankyrin repeat domain-containing protein 34B isoform X1 [Salmo salar]
MEDATEVRTDGNSLLKAVFLSRLRLTRLLLEGGAYINESNERGETPLMVACRTRHTDAQSVPKHKMVRYLLESGADPNIQDKAGKTALMHACLEQAEVDVLTLLLGSGADPSLNDHSGSSALVYAVNARDKEALRVLLDACKAKGKEVIIITTDKLPSGCQLTKQYLNVPPPTDLEERMHCTPGLATCCMSPSDIQLRTPPQGSPAIASPQPGSPLLGLMEHHHQGGGRGTTISGSNGSGSSQPGSPTRDPSLLRGPSPGVVKLLHVQRLHSEPWLKIPPSLLLQQSKASSLTEELLDITPEEELSFWVNSLAFSGSRRAGPGVHPTLARHQSIDAKDATGLLRALEPLAHHNTFFHIFFVSQVAGSEGGGRGRRRGLSRKMSYDSAAASSHPNLLHRGDGGGCPNCPSGGHEPVLPVDKTSLDCCLPNLAVSSLRNVVRRRNIGMDHYSSDSQLPQFGHSSHPECNEFYKGIGCGIGETETRKLVTSRSSTLSGSRESLETTAQRRGPANLERRGSGALLLDHISHTRPGYLPPLNPHAPIPDIGVSPTSTCPSLSGSTKALNLNGGVAAGPGSKPLVPCAPSFHRDLKFKTLLRRHSMQTEQIKQLVNFEELFSH